MDSRVLPYRSEEEKPPLYQQIFTNPIDGFKELAYNIRHPVKSVKSAAEKRLGDDIKKYATGWTWAKAGAAFAITEFTMEIGVEQVGVPLALYLLGYRELAGAAAVAAPFVHWAHFLSIPVAICVAANDVKKRKAKALKYQQAIYEEARAGK